MNQRSTFRFLIALFCSFYFNLLSANSNHQSALPDWTQLWQQSPPRDLTSYALAAMPDGGYLQLTQATGVGNAFATPTLVRYQADGTRLWVLPDLAADSTASCGAELNVWTDGTFVAAYFDTALGVGALVVKKINGADGTVLWQQKYPLSIEHFWCNIKMARNDVSGAIAIALNSQNDALILRITNDGTVLPELRAIPPQGVLTLTQAIAFSPDNGVVIGYEITAPSGRYVYRTTGFSVDGVQVFSYDYQGPSGRIGNASWLKVDQAGNIYVLMTPESSNGGFGLHLQKLSPLGVKLWGYTPFSAFDGIQPRELDAKPVGLLLNQAGDPLVLYYRHLEFDSRLAQFSADGVLRWHRNYVDLGSPVPIDFAIDNAGHTRVVSWSNNGILAPSVAEFVEWDANGTRCASSIIPTHGTQTIPSHVAASNLGWGVAGRSYIENAGALLLMHFPKVTDCTNEAIFADAMEDQFLF